MQHISLSISKHILRGIRINGFTPFILGKVNPILGSISSLTYNTFTEIEHNNISSGGLMGGDDRLPPSKTTISESMSWVDNLKWFDGTITSRRMFVIFRFFFCERRDLRWRTFDDNTFRCVTAASTHWVHREVVELDLEKTCTQGWEWGGGKADANSTSCSSPQVSIVWQLKAYETILD
jgi:hypothetical protein